MKLLTKELEQRFEQVGNQQNNSDPLIIAKFFNPSGGGDWFASEYDKNDKIFFGYVSLFNDWNNEWGSFSLEELESFRGHFGMGIERDIHFKEMKLSEVKKIYGIV